MSQQHAATEAARPPGQPNPAVAGPFTARDLTVFAAVVVTLIASLLPLALQFGYTANLWEVYSLFYVGIAAILPLIVAAMFLVRRLSPGTALRVGSLSTDQFASVVACLATAFFFLATVTDFNVAFLVGLIGALALLVATVLAPMLPPFAGDFAGRPEVPAHVVARNAVPAPVRPAAPKPALALSQGSTAGTKVSAAEKATAGSSALAGSGAAAGGTASGSGMEQAGAAKTPAVSGKASGSGKATRSDTPAGSGKASAVSGTTSAEPLQTGPTPVPATAAPATASPAAAAPATASPATAATPAAGAGAGSSRPQAAASVPDEVAAAVVPATDATESDSAVTDAAAAAALAQAQAAPATTRQSTVEAGRGAQGSGRQDRRESIGATVDPANRSHGKESQAHPSPAQDPRSQDTGEPAAPEVHHPFWFAVDRPKNVVDQQTRKFLFKLTPGVWILALADRGTDFLVQDSDGRVGILLDLDGIERAPEAG